VAEGTSDFVRLYGRRYCLTGMALTLEKVDREDRSPGQGSLGDELLRESQPGNPRNRRDLTMTYRLKDRRIRALSPSI
jgi:hypothetical protein